jgi:hypothetical protein
MDGELGINIRFQMTDMSQIVVARIGFATHVLGLSWPNVTRGTALLGRKAQIANVAGRTLAMLVCQWLCTALPGLQRVLYCIS